jgi:putative nucleotidyltransferase with HDIG domain
MSRGKSSRTRKDGIPHSAQRITVEAIELARWRSLRLWSYGAALNLAAVGLFIGVFASGFRPGPLVPTVVMAFAALVSEKQSVRVGPNLEASVGFLPGLFAAVALGPISAMIVVGVGLLAALGRPWERWLVWNGSRCLWYGIAALAVVHLGSGGNLAQLFTKVGVAAVIAMTGEAISGTITVRIRRSANSALSHFLEALRVSALGMIIYVPVIAGLEYVYTALSTWSVVLFIGPAIAAQRYFVLFRNQKVTAAELSRAVKQLERVNLSFATALVTALDARDHYTAGHSATVAVYARDIAAQCGFSSDERDKAHLCGLLHDIGKIGVPVGVLEKKGALAKSERASIESHAEVGASILGRIEGYEEIAIAVRHHHERYEGGGYPDRVRGEEIPLMARIVAVADAYSAMTSERPYRVALSGAEARERLEQEAGKQFDPHVVEAFVAVLERAGEVYASGADNNFERELAGLVALEPEASLAASS